MVSRRFLHLFIAVLIALALPGLVAALAQGEASVTPIVNTLENEPNNGPWQANYGTFMNMFQGKIAPAGDVDYFQFYLNSEAPLTVTVTQPAGSPLAAHVALYDRSEQLLTEADCTADPCLEYLMPTGDGFYLVVSDANGAGGPTYEYEFMVAVTDPNEPNNFFSQATPVTIGTSFAGVIYPAGDVDLFALPMEEGQAVRVYGQNAQMSFLDPDGEYLQQVYSGTILRAAEAGLYYLLVDEGSSDSATPYSFTVHNVDRFIYLSFARPGNIGGVAYQPGDVLKYSTLNKDWSMFFDASDVRLKGNLVAFDVDSNEYELFLVYGSAQNVPGIGRITPQDMIHFSVESTGEQTAGMLTLWLDGSDLGLTGTAESIDALSGGYYNSVMSTSGDALVPYGMAPLLFKDEDVFELYLMNHGQDSGGYWEPFLSGNAMGLKPNVDLTGLDLDSASGSFPGVFFTVDRATTAQDVALSAGDIALCNKSWDPGCTSLVKFWDASDAGVGANKIDAIAVGDYFTP